MFSIELKDNTRKIEIETDIAVVLYHERVQAFIKAIEALHVATPLTRFIGKRHPMNALVYMYTFDTEDGRTWNQDISFEDGVRMTFDVEEYWKLEEFVPHREVRNEFVLMVRDFGLERAEVTYGIP